MNQNPKKTYSERLQTGGPAFFITLTAALLTVCILLPILISGAMKPSPKLEPTDNGTVTDSGDTQPQEPQFVPVFAPTAVAVKPYSTASTAQATIDSQFGVLMDAESGEILAQKGSSVPFSPASMTKVMTLIVACENLSEADLSRKIPFSEEIHAYVTSGQYRGTELGLPVTSGGITCIGDRYFIKDLLYGVGIQSAADCTYMIVREICDTEADFVALMNQKAKALGLTQTVFDNAVGFDSQGNLTTAEDMAVIMAYAMESPLIADILKPRTQRYGIKSHYTDDYGAEKTYDVWFECSFISRHEKYPSFKLNTVELDATKTGYTNESFIVCHATSVSTGKRYILVLGNQTSVHNTITAKFKATMMDIETIYNQYVS